jgi:hypothetical protein
MKSNMELLGNYDPSESRHIIAKFIQCDGRCNISGDTLMKMTAFNEDNDHNSYGYVVAKLGKKEIERAHQIRTDVYKIKFVFKSNNKKVAKEQVKGYVGMAATKNWLE